MKSLKTDITGATASFDRFLSFMPNPSALTLSGLPSGTYAEMLNDAHIAAKLSRLKDDVTARDWSVLPASADQQDIENAQLVTRILQNHTDMTALTENLLSAVEFGFAFGEIIWDYVDGLWVPKEIAVRSPERFRFKQDGTPVMFGTEGAQELTAPYKFIIHRHEPKQDNPYGSPVLAKCYWPWQFKKAGLRFWLTAAEKYGVPTVMALFSADNDSEAAERASTLAHSLAGIQSDAAVALANVDEVKTLESHGGTADFQALVELCNQEISKAVTGEILSSDIGSSGSYALAAEHGRTLSAKGRKLALSLAGTLNRTLVHWITLLNVGEDAKPPRFTFDLAALPSWEMVKDAIDRGIPVSKKALYEHYNLPKPESELDQFTR